MSIQIELSDDEALILFEWIAQREEANKDEDPVATETKVFWTIEAQLENTLCEPFDPDYLRLLEEARSRVLNR